MNRLNEHVDSLFRGYKKNKQVKELKEEILSNLEAKVIDLTSEGIEYDEAVRIAIESIDSVDYLIDKDEDIKKRYKRYGAILKLIALVILGFYLITASYSYIVYGKVLERNKLIEMELRNDLNELNAKDVGELNKVGIDGDELRSIRSIVKSDKMKLHEILDVMFATINIDNYGNDLQELHYIVYDKPIDDHEMVVGEKNVKLDVKPLEAVYSSKDKKTYIKLFYSASIEQPSLFLPQNTYVLRNNNFNYFFGISKLQYVSKSGENYFEYSSRDFLQYKKIRNSDISLTAKNRKKINDEMFYLKGISGVVILEANQLKDLFTYSEFSYDQFFRKKAISKLWSNWKLESLPQVR